MKVGDYVRTTDGYIGEITDIIEDLSIDCDTGVFDIAGEPMCEIPYNLKDKYIIDSNYDILELIYPGDLLYIDISPDDCGGIVVPRTTETQNEVNEYKELIKSGKYILKGILTRDLIKRNYYWIDGDNNDNTST